MKLNLSNVPIFTGLSDRAMEIFLEHAKEHSFAPDSIIATENETNDAMYFIEAGEVSIIKNYGTDNPAILAVLGAGECFGEMCVLDTQPRSATARAVTVTKVWAVDSKAFFQLYAKAPDQYCIILLNIARDLSRRLRHLGDAFAARL